MALPTISDSAVRRLSHYLRFLEDLEAGGSRTVSSDDLAAMGGLTSAQVRKDLSHFGSFGKRGLGYPVPVLRERVAAILGLARRWRACLVGAGKLGSALYHYGGFHGRGFDIAAVFDNDPSRIGRRWGSLAVDAVDDLARVVAERSIALGIIVTPAGAAQDVADALVEAGIEGILNFAPRKLSIPAEIVLRDVNLAMELETLTFTLTHKGEILTTR